MGKVKYTVRENIKTGTHSWYAVPVYTGKLTFAELCEEAADDNTYSVEEIQGCVSKFMKIVQREVGRGFRCEVGTNFLTVYPNIQCSVKDELNPDKTVKKVAQKDDVKANNAKARLGCTVSNKFSTEFANNVSWVKVDAHGDEEEDDITQGNENVENGSDNTQGGGDTPDPNEGGSNEE